MSACLFLGQFGEIWSLTDDEPYSSKSTTSSFNSSIIISINNSFPERNDNYGAQYIFTFWWFMLLHHIWGTGFHNYTHNFLLLIFWSHEWAGEFTLETHDWQRCEIQPFHVFWCWFATPLNLSFVPKISFSLWGIFWVNLSTFPCLHWRSALVLRTSDLKNEVLHLMWCVIPDSTFLT
jgi:hypothetical protein